MTLTLYTIALEILVRLARKTTIVVVGANDGKISDPIYEFTMRNRLRTKVLLIEPNTLLMPFLQANYSTHPSHQIANCAIGPEGVLTLWTIKPTRWDLYRPAHAKGWPVHRAATGLTSADRTHLERALASENLDPLDMLATLEVQCRELLPLLSESKFRLPIDVLQIDAEGYDDEVIYSSDILLTRPKLMLFERVHLSGSRLQALTSFLSKLHYKVYAAGDSGLAVDSRIRPICLLLNTAVTLGLLVREATRYARLALRRLRARSSAAIDQV